MEQFWSESIDLVCPICNNKRSDNSYELYYQLIDLVMISFELIFMPARVNPYSYNDLKWSGWIWLNLLLIRKHNNCPLFVWLYRFQLDIKRFHNYLIMILLTWLCGNKRNRVRVSLWSFDLSWSCLISNGITISTSVIRFQIVIGY